MYHLKMAQVERIGHHANALVGIGQHAGHERRRARTCQVVQHARTVAVERAVHFRGAIDEAVKQLRLGNDIRQHAHRGRLVGFRQRMGAIECGKAAVVAQKAGDHRVLVRRIKRSFRQRAHQARARRCGALVFRVERASLHRAHGGGHAGPAGAEDGKAKGRGGRCGWGRFHHPERWISNKSRKALWERACPR